MKKKILPLLLVLALFLGLAAVPAAATDNPFDDVQTSDYWYDAVLWALDNQITKGTTETSFGSDVPCTRGQIVEFLYRAMGRPDFSNEENPFSDVDSSSYYYNAVLWAVENKITTGTTETSFSPDQPCTRGQIMEFIYRALQKPEVGMSAAPFADVYESDYYYNAVLWAVENGVTTGAGGTNFFPAAVCTRAQIVTFLYRALTEKDEAALSAGAAHEHLYDFEVIAEPSCLEDGTAMHTCLICGESYAERIVAGEEYHNWDISVVPPTATAQGYTVYTCTVCGATYQEDYVPVTAGVPSPGQISYSPTVAAYAEVEVGSTLELPLLAAYYNISDGDLGWTTSEPSVASVDAAGILTGLSEGSSIVQCMNGAGIPLAVFTVSVNAKASYESVIQDKLLAMKAVYPEGMKWTNANYYAWNAGADIGQNAGWGCVAFAYILSDAAFGDLPARKITKVRFENVRVGDILRIKNNGHSVVVLEKHDDYVVIAEGNYKKTIHWGRTLSKSVVNGANYMLTRYPD